MFIVGSHENFSALRRSAMCLRSPTSNLLAILPGFSLWVVAIAATHCTPSERGFKLPKAINISLFRSEKAVIFGRASLTCRDVGFQDQCR